MTNTLIKSLDKVCDNDFNRCCQIELHSDVQFDSKELILLDFDIIRSCAGESTTLLGHVSIFVGIRFPSHIA